MDEDLESMDRDALIAEVKRLRAAFERIETAPATTCAAPSTALGLLPEQTNLDVAVPPWPRFLRGCVAYREALDRELPGAPVADLDYDASE